MSDIWTFDPACDDDDEVKCGECGRTVASTEPCFSHRDHVRRWAFLCTDCACVLLGERGTP